MTTKIPVELSSTPGIVDGSNATAITIDSSENVTITGDLGVTGGQINTGNTAGDHSEFGTDGSGHTFIDASSSGANMFFQQGGATKVSISSGNVNIADGNLVVASGHGIDFSATGGPTTVSSELFDDYEEGVFEATLADSGGGATYTLNSSFNQLSYTKVGRIVHIHGTLVVSGVSGTPNGSLNVTNLPFTSIDLVDQGGKSGGLGVGYYQVQKYTSGVFPQSSLGEGSTALFLFYGVADANTYNTKANNATQLYFDFTYPAA